MLRRLSLLGLALFVSGGFAAGLRGVTAQVATPSNPAYYIVVLGTGSDSSSTSVTQVTVQDGSSVTSIQVATGGSAVGCTPYDNQADAEAAAAVAHPDQAWVVVLAPDALHALLQAMGQSDVTAMLPLPLVPDAAVCTP